MLADVQKWSDVTMQKLDHHSVKFAIAAEKDKKACDSQAATPGELTAQKERNG